jgi:uncharacterized circularly permuted ATP-grasp superfamily protein
VPPRARRALLDDILRRVLDAGVDVAELGQREEVRGVVGVVEHVRRGLVDRRRASLGDGIGAAPAWICLVSKRQFSDADMSCSCG